MPNMAIIKEFSMQNAIEFIATKKNNRLIEIPEELADEVSGQFRVILLFDQQTTTPEPKKSRKREFNAIKVELKGYKFNRDDAYDE
jgi:hypothetical protein